MVDPVVTYSVKVEADDLALAKKFFARSELQVQDAVRSLIRTAASCETCLELVDARAPISEVQSSFASIIADAKETWRLNGLFQDTMLKAAEMSKLPQDFITNVLAEAQHIHAVKLKPERSSDGKP